MIYIKLVDRTAHGAKAREYKSYLDTANLATIICQFALERQIAPNRVLCQVYKRKEWEEERKSHYEQIRNENQ